MILLIRMMSYCDNKNNSWSEEFPTIHFIIYEDKVVLRVEQNIVDSIRDYKRDFICITLLEKKIVPSNTELVCVFFQTFSLIFIVKKMSCYDDDIDFKRT